MKQHGFSHFLIVGAIAVVLAGILAFVFIANLDKKKQNNGEPTATNNAQDVIANDGKYKSNNFEFEYNPKGWTLKEDGYYDSSDEEAGLITVPFLSTTDYTSESIGGSPETGSMIKLATTRKSEWKSIEDVKEYYSTLANENADITVSGMEAFRSESASIFEDGDINIQVYFFKDSTQYNLGYFGANKAQTENIDNFEKVVSSFKFK